MATFTISRSSEPFDGYASICMSFLLLLSLSQCSESFDDYVSTMALHGCALKL